MSTNTEITVSATYNAADLATLQATGEQTEAAFAGIECTDAEAYALFDASLSDVLKTADSIVNARADLLRPFKEKIRDVEAVFRAALAPWERTRDMLKQRMGVFLLAKAAAEKAERAKALEAAKAQDDAKMQTALVEAAKVSDDKAAALADAKGRASFAWAIKRIVPELLPDEFWTPDVAKIEAIAKAWPGASEDPPVVAGVVFERVARIAGSHK